MFPLVLLIYRGSFCHLPCVVVIVNALYPLPIFIVTFVLVFLLKKNRLKRSWETNGEEPLPEGSDPMTDRVSVWMWSRRYLETLGREKCIPKSWWRQNKNNYCRSRGRSQTKKCVSFSHFFSRLSPSWPCVVFPLFAVQLARGTGTREKTSQKLRRTGMVADDGRRTVRYRQEVFRASRHVRQRFRHMGRRKSGIVV